MTVDFVGIGEAAHILGLSRTSIQKLVDSGQLPAVKTNGGHRRILRSSIENLDQKMGPKAMLRLATHHMGSSRNALPKGQGQTQDVQVLIVEDDAVTATALVGMFEAYYPEVRCTVGSARVWTPWSHHDLVCRLLLEKKKPKKVMHREAH